MNINYVFKNTATAVLPRVCNVNEVVFTTIYIIHFSQENSIPEMAILAILMNIVTFTPFLRKQHKLFILRYIGAITAETGARHVRCAF